jgi:hypothetical protein
MWIQLTVSSLRSAMSGPERQTLDRAAVDPDQQSVLAEIAANVANEWRGGLRSVCVIDSRTSYIPDELLVHILADFRYRAATRLPSMKALLDELRVKEWDRAMKIRDNLKGMTFVIPAAEYQESADQSGNNTELASGDGAYPTSTQMDGLL